ncbi:N-alpha-acetyltransferase 80 isoform X2 [Diachasma alloeum]|nr:N-alpha-acetyltransferase 80 isoform X2 [Diachasma alloeum]
MVNPSSYTIVPMHERPDLLKETSRLINSQWPASERRRLRTLEASCDNFPINLILLKDDRVIGHCRMSRMPSQEDSCFMETFVIDREHRSQGLGSKLLQAAGELMSKKGIKNSFLSTKGQEQFYSKNGYKICETADIMAGWDRVPPQHPQLPFKKTNLLSKFSTAAPAPAPAPPPPPPPMPRNRFIVPQTVLLYPGRTHMLKRL